MSQLNVNIVAPLGYTGPDLPGDSNFVQVTDVNGDTVLKIPGVTSNNIAIGLNTMIATTGSGNTVVGDSALALATTGQDNTAFGSGSLGGLTTGTENVAVGSQSGQNIISSNENTLVGFQAGFGDFSLGLGNNNTFVGNRAGYNSSGSSNVFIGWTTALNATSGNNNIVIGSGADKATPTSSNSITLGNSSISVLRCQVTSITSLSDARDKKDVKDLSAGLDFINEIKPVSFVWKDRDKDGKQGVKDSGFTAQNLKEVQEKYNLSEELKLVYDENPEKLEASYGRLIPVLVKAIQEMSSEIKSLKEEIEILKQNKMSQINVNVVAPVGYTGPNLPGDNNFVQIVDVNGNTIFKSSNTYNIAIGIDSAPNLVGVPNIAIGDESMLNSTLAAGNVCIGSQSGINLIDGGSNTYVGNSSGGSTTSGVGNAALGNDAGYNITTGSNNICIGDSSFTATPTTSNSITLGNSSHTVIRAAVTTITSLSDERDKKDITDLSAGLDFVKGLKPVEFVWDERGEDGKKDIKDFGFIAQDLKKSQEDAGLAETLKLVYEENPEKLEASYGKLVPILVKAIQELTAKVEALEAK